MGLNTHVEAKPASMHTLARHLDDVTDRVDIASSAAHSAYMTAGDWQGRAGEGFQAVANRLRNEGSSVADAYRCGAKTLRRHAHDIEAVRRRMGDARDVARNAGLDVTEREIRDPGPPPPEPEPILPSDVGDAADAKRQALSTYRQWTEKAAVYAQCTAMVAEARTMETTAQQNAVAALKGALTDKPLVTAADVTTGLASAYLTQQKTWRTRAAWWGNVATEAADASRNMNHGAPLQTRNLMVSMFSKVQQDINTAKADSHKIGRWIEKLPTRAQNALTWKLERLFPKNRPFISKAPGVVRKLPGLGGLFSAASVAMDMANGKNPATSIATAGSGLLTGTVAGGIVGGPPGALFGFVMGTGASIATGQILDPANQDTHIIAPEADTRYRMEPDK